MNRMRSLLWAWAILVVLGSTVPAQAAYEFYMTVEGTKQGKFKGEDQPLKGGIPSLGLEFSVEAPREVATGQATGRRQYSPLTITKEWGASSPQLFAALVSNEVLKSVQFLFFDSPPGGTQPPYATITLTNAELSKIQYRLATSPQEPAAPGVLLEDVSFTFQKIEMTSREGNTASVDHVDGPAGVIAFPLLRNQ